MSAQPVSGNEHSSQEAALVSLAASAAGNIPGVDLVSITVRDGDRPLYTAAATDALAEQADALQYELREGPCYAAVTDERFVVVNDMSAAVDFPRYGPRVVELGLRAQAAIQLVDGRRRAGLNLYARAAGSFDRSTVQFAELFATQAGSLLGYAEQVEQLSEGLHTRTDIGIAVGMLMERYGIDQHKAFAFLTRHSNNRNVKLRVLAKEVANGSFQSTPDKVRQSQA
jgi:hypothetical protein